MFHLTPDIMRKSYEMIAVTPPMRGWRLPPSEEIVFRVVNSEKYQGLFDTYREHYRITMSTVFLSLLTPVTSIMAHEMIHLYQRIADRETEELEHNPDFRRLADRVSSRLGITVY